MTPSPDSPSTADPTDRYRQLVAILTQLSQRDLADIAALPHSDALALLQALADAAAVALDHVSAYRQLETRVTECTENLASFAGAVSHDVRAPVRQIQLFATMLRETHAGELPVSCDAGLETIADEAGHLADVTDALLRYFETTSLALERQSLDLAAIARAVAVECAAISARPVEFVAPSELIASMDPRLARIVFQNLLGNAWKFSGKAALPRIEFGRLPAAAASPPTYFVRDNGAGFDGTNGRQLFGLFRRLHKPADFPGIGTGLATVDQIIRRHGGRIWAESRPGEGATFFFTVGEARSTSIAQVADPTLRTRQ